MIVRSITRDDASALAVLLDALGYPATEQQTRARIALLSAEPQTRLLLAAQEDQVLGLVGVRVEHCIEEDAPIARLIALIVAPAARRRGVGRMLVSAAETAARALGCTRVTLTSAERRGDAHAFYRAIGYEATGRRFGKHL